MTHWITAEFLARVYHIDHAVPGQIIHADGQRYLIISFNKFEQRYQAARDPGPYPSLVLYRPICSCGYRSSLGSHDKQQAYEAAYQHYISEHLMLITPEIPHTTEIPYEWDIEPYWHT